MNPKADTARRTPRKDPMDALPTIPVGTPVRYWTGFREGDGKVSRTRSAVQLLGGHTPVVWVQDESSCIGLTHVDVISDRELAAVRASQAAQGPNSPEDDAGAAQGLHRPAVACTEPPHYLVETHDGHGWCTLAVYGNPDEARAHKIWANRGDRDRIVRVTREVTREVIQ